MVKSVANRCILPATPFIEFSRGRSQSLSVRFSVQITKAWQIERRVAFNAITLTRLSLWDSQPSSSLCTVEQSHFSKVFLPPKILESLKQLNIFSGGLERDSAADGGGEEDAYLGGLSDPHEVAAHQVRGEVAQEDPQEDQEQGGLGKCGSVVFPLHGDFTVTCNTAGWLVFQSF